MGGLDTPSETATPVLAKSLTRYFSMFSGIGGFELGIAERGECVGYSEIDKYAILTYEEHYEHRNYGDATTIDERQLPDFDLLVGGFPCQAFSVAGKRHGFNETRGTLFFDIARVLKHKRPRHLVLENVKGLLSHDTGKTFTTIIGVLTDLGYDVEWQVLNSKRWVPQNRERVYVIGHLRGECSRQIFPFTDNGTKSEKRHIRAAGINNPSRGYEIRRDGLAGTLRAAEMGSKNIIGIIVAGNIWGGVSGRIYSPEGKSPTLSTASTGGLQQPKIFVSDTQIRRLTPIETERLQGFPDGWTFGSDTQRYKQTGNAVTVNVVDAVITAMCHEGCLQTEGIS